MLQDGDTFPFFPSSGRGRREPTDTISGTPAIDNFLLQGDLAAPELESESINRLYWNPDLAEWPRA
ncbi:MAG: hypothetical protein AMXMBFR20_35000 [Planctomycetia bacterium]